MEKELQEFRSELDKIKEFCVLVAVEHNHIPSLKRAWHDDAGELVDKNNTQWENNSIATIMKTLMHIISRIEYLEDAERRE